jgi:hypothetical protein
MKRRHFGSLLTEHFCVSFDSNLCLTLIDESQALTQQWQKESRLENSSIVEQNNLLTQELTDARSSAQQWQEENKERERERERDTSSILKVNLSFQF